MKITRITRKCGRWCFPPVVLFLFPIIAWAGDPVAKQPAKDPAKCELIVEGKDVVRISLFPQNSTSANGVISPVSLDVKPGASLFLPPGTYTIWNIELQGGYQGYSGESLTLAPDTPCKLTVGTLLKSSLRVNRQGRLLKINYELLDAQGRKYNKTDRNAPPRFIVYQGDREIGSGMFEYG